MSVTLAIAASYFLGAVPFGLLVARLRGIDIRAVGSGNIGATNVFRAVGPGWGIFTLLCDILKGLVPALVFPMVVARVTAADAPSWLALACGCTAVAGHNWPVYIGFKGGKGVATTAGALVGIAPTPLGLGVLTFAVVFGLTRYVSLGSVLASVVIPAAAWGLLFRHPENGALTPSVLTLLGIVVIAKHRANIARLFAGTESRIAFRRHS